MFVRSKSDVRAVEWGNGSSHRLLVAADNMGFTVADTLVRAGTKSRLQYRRHLEACYCISGHGEVLAADGSVVYTIEPGVLYALDQHDAHFLVAAPQGDMRLISIFNPPLNGDEVHDLDGDGFSHY
ncbi:ectoine synthase [Nocardia sp. NPDC052566]|uniref:ectoine synthase n=1 Tax=Nocardia sp. NPDC052566 TaxID=3364330 RepID=UPI0037C8C3DF